MPEGFGRSVLVPVNPPGDDAFWDWLSGGAAPPIGGAPITWASDLLARNELRTRRGGTFAPHEAVGSASLAQGSGTTAAIVPSVDVGQQLASSNLPWLVLIAIALIWLVK